MKLLGGVWLPEHETHLVEHMQQNRREVAGKLTYQKQKLDRALTFCKRRGFALDIGGHVGLWSMWLVCEFKDVVAFEPVPALANIFRRNVTALNCHLNECALGETEQLIDMQVPVETTGNSHVAIEGQHPGTRGVQHPDRIRLYRDIPMLKLDSFGFNDVDFIKIDVEGFERAVIAGAEQTIKRSRPVIVVEQKKNESVYGDVVDAASKLLLSWGMVCGASLSGDQVMIWP